MSNSVKLILKCKNPNCSHEFHLCEINYNPLMEIMPLPVPADQIVVRLDNEVDEILESIPDSDSLNNFINKIGGHYYSEENHKKGDTIFLREVPLAPMEDIRFLYTGASELNEEQDDQVDGDTIANYSSEVIHYTPSTSLNELENAQARLVHYQSEIARLEAIKLSNNL